MWAEDAEDEDEGVEPVKFMWSEVAGSAANFVANLSKAVTALAVDWTIIARRHSAYSWDRDTAYDRMQLELESLPTTE